MMLQSSTLRLARLLPRTPVATRAFHATRPAFVSVGDRIPDLELVEDSPGNKVNLSKELTSGKGLIIGVPAAFCTLVIFFLSFFDVNFDLSADHLLNKAKKRRFNQSSSTCPDLNIKINWTSVPKSL